MTIKLLKYLKVFVYVYYVKKYTKARFTATGIGCADANAPIFSLHCLSSNTPYRQEKRNVPLSEWRVCI